jgi:hypothetical protein
MVKAAWASSETSVVTSVALWHVGRAWDDGSRTGEQWHLAVTGDDFSSSTPSGLDAGSPGDGLETLRRPRARILGDMVVQERPCLHYLQ